jgi:retron-type reverse transcriptase
VDRAKPFDIPKRAVWEAYKRVRANHGAAGVDGQSIADFEADLSNNLYKLWNRMSSGSYFPPPVRRVEIPKDDGTPRPLGIPTVADRVAQMVVKRFLEPLVEPRFHRDSLATGPASRRLMRSASRGNAAGVTPGFLISTSRPSSTASTGIC